MKHMTRLAARLPGRGLSYSRRPRLYERWHRADMRPSPWTRSARPFQR